MKKLSNNFTILYLVFSKNFPDENKKKLGMNEKKRIANVLSLFIPFFLSIIKHSYSLYPHSYGHAFLPLFFAAVCCC
jgi:phosphoglycerol transferase MdoB-like AlkP superfamily enzyme